MMNRRNFLHHGAMQAIATGALMSTPLLVTRMAQAATETGATRPKTLVVVFQRGGMDGLMAVTPYTDAGLAKLRPGLMLPRPGSGAADALIDLDGQFGLHPAFTPLAPLFRDGHLAVVHGVGSPHNTRSHGEATQWWESGTPGNKLRSDGWLNRAIGAAAIEGKPLLPAVAMAPQMPRILYGNASAVALENLGQLQLAGTPDAAHALQALYAHSTNRLLRSSGDAGFEVARILAANAPSASTTTYPSDSAFATSLREIAQLIKADVGMRVAFAESRTVGQGKHRGSWDSHSNERSLQGPFATIASDFAHSIAAFWQDLDQRRDDVVLVSMTEFGRNVVENSGNGTDHGRATAMFVLGHSVNGGKVHAFLPERFERDALEDHMDLPVGIDYRRVLAELADKQLGVVDRAALFPGWNGQPLTLLKG